MTQPSISSDPNAWLHLFYARLQTQPGFASVVPAIRLRNGKYQLPGGPARTRISPWRQSGYVLSILECGDGSARHGATPLGRGRSTSTALSQAPLVARLVPSS